VQVTDSGTLLVCGFPRAPLSQEFYVERLY